MDKQEFINTMCTRPHFYKCEEDCESCEYFLSENTNYTFGDDNMKYKQEDADHLADIIWFIKGWNHAESDCPFDGTYIESLRKARILIDKEIEIHGHDN